LYPLVARNELAFGNGNLFLQRAVLLDKLSLYNSQLLEIALQEHHFLLLGAVVGGTENIVVLLAGLV
jgi:hypothetical protein